MNQAIATFAACFAIGGFGIPLHAPGLIFDQYYCSKRERLLFAALLVTWCACVTYAVIYFVKRAG